MATPSNMTQLISTIPLDVLVTSSDLSDEMKAPSHQIALFKSTCLWHRTFGQTTKRCREKNAGCIFPKIHRHIFGPLSFPTTHPITFPTLKKYWSLMVEVSESPKKAVNRETIKDEVIKGLKATRLIEEEEQIVDFWQYETEHGYPTPFLGRDAVFESSVVTFGRPEHL